MKSNRIRLFMNNLKYMMTIMIKTAPLFLVLTIMFSIVSGLGNVSQSYFLSKLIDGFMGSVPLSRLAMFSVLIVVFQFIAKIQNRILFSLNRVVTDEIGIAMERGVLRAVDTITLTQMDDPEFHNRLEQARTLTRRTPNSIFMILFGFIGLLTSAIGYFILLSRVNVMYVFLLIGGSVLLFIANNRYEENVLSFLFAMSPERRKMNYFSDLLTKRDSYEEVHSYGAMEYLRRQFDANAKKQLNASWSIFTKYSWRYTAAAMLSYIACAVVYILIVRLTYNHQISIGDAAMFLTACLGFQGVLTELIDGVSALPQELMTLQNYREFIQSKKQPLSQPIQYSEVNIKNENVIEVNNLRFAYPGTAKNVLDGVSFTVKKGETAALVGLNGSGKTTLVRILAGFYHNYEGEVYINGKELRQMLPDERNASVSILYQNYLKPSLPILEAVTYSENTVEMHDKAKRVLEMSEYPLEDENAVLTKLYSPIGIIPSGGQWQKIALARMLYRDADVFILDEPSAALDPQAEDAVFRLINELKIGRSIIYVTHRLGSVATADSILYLNHEGVLQQAKHMELLQDNDDYRKLYYAQADKYKING